MHRSTAIVVTLLLACGDAARETGGGAGAGGIPGGGGSPAGSGGDGGVGGLGEGGGNAGAGGDAAGGHGGAPGAGGAAGGGGEGGDGGAGGDGGRGGEGGDGGDGGGPPVEEGPLQLATSTLIGGRWFDRAQGVFVHPVTGDIYLGGNTGSDDFPATKGAYDTTKNGPAGIGNVTQDGFVAKLSPHGSRLIWATYLGGSKRDQVYGVRVDGDGHVYAVGSTGSADFPTTAGAYDETHNGPTGDNDLADVFVVKLEPDGSDLVWSTFVGGKGSESSRGGMYLAADGTVTIAGHTTSSDFPTVAPAAQSKYGGGPGDAFVFRISTDGSRLEASTYLGGAGDDAALSGAVVLADGSVVIAGGTASAAFPTTAGAHDRTFGGPGGSHFADGDGFVARLPADLSALAFASYVGGSGKDYILHNQGLAVDASGRPVLLGSTTSDDLGVPAGTFQPDRAGGVDGFVAIVAEDGSGLDAITYVGGSKDEEVSGIVVDAMGRVYLSGNTHSDDWPVTADAHQRLYGGGTTDVMLTVFQPDLSSLVYSTYFGGTGGTSALGERGRGVWLTPRGIAVSGDTDSTDFPTTPGALDRTHNGDVDGFVLRFERAVLPP